MEPGWRFGLELCLEKTLKYFSVLLTRRICWLNESYLTKKISQYQKFVSRIADLHKSGGQKVISESFDICGAQRETAALQKEH